MAKFALLIDQNANYHLDESNHSLDWSIAKLLIH